MKTKLLVILLSFNLLNSSCTSVKGNPPYLGVFLRDDSNFTPLDQFTGPPDTIPKVSVDVSNPTFTAWLEGFDAKNFLLVSYTSADRIKNQVAFNLRPLQEEGMYDVLVSELPELDVYCFVLVDPLSVVYRMPHWCFSHRASITREVDSTREIIVTETKVIAPTENALVSPENANTLVEIHRIDNIGWVYAIDWSPKGDQIAVVGDTGVFLYDNQTFEEENHIEYLENDIPSQQVFYTLNGASLVYTSLLDTKLASVVEKTPGTILNGCYHCALSPDRTHMACMRYDPDHGNNYSLSLWRVTDNGVEEIFTKQILGIWTHSALSFSPDGTLLAANSMGIDSTDFYGSIILWSIPDGSQVLEIKQPSEPFLYNLFSPDGTLLASLSEYGTIKLWRVSDGNQLFALQGQDNIWGSLKFSPDGTILVTTSENKINLWRVADGNLVQTLTGHSEPVNDFAFSPDGSLLASGGVGNPISIWRVSDGQLLSTIHGHYDITDLVAFSPDGVFLTTASRLGLQIWGVP